MSGKVFLDTNVLVYGQDRREPGKQRMAQGLARTVMEEGNGVVSTQVLQEFYAAATMKLRVDPLAAKALLRSFTSFETVQVTPALIQEAIDCSILNRLSFWDSLIVAAASGSGCTTVYSEDLNPGQSIMGVTVVNPFAKK